MAKLRKWIGNLKVSAKLQVYRMAVLVMTAFFVLVALVSTLVIRSTIHSITEVWSPSLECLQELQTITAKYQNQTVSASCRNRYSSYGSL